MKDRVVLVGQPNVGKSLLFNRLSNSRIVVSNYPGTTTTLNSAKMKLGFRTKELIDCPGTYSLDPLTEDQEVAIPILDEAEIIVNVIDSKNIDRMLPFTFELLKKGYNVVIALNMQDEALTRGVQIDEKKLSDQLGIPVVKTIATEGKGIRKLKKSIFTYEKGKFKARSVKTTLKETVKYKKTNGHHWNDKISAILTNPFTGSIFLFLIVYFGLYQFVGVFGAGTLVDLIEVNVFENWLNPLVDSALTIIPYEAIRELIGGEYGILTFGLRYAIAIILPIIVTFFLVFSLIEDSGYLPRLALLVDRLFKKIGLNGRAIIPMVLGLGCDTMATIVTRTLQSKKEKIISTFLLALAVPCSAQMGVILAVLAFNPIALVLWIIIVLITFFLIGLLSNKFVKGDSGRFFMDLPPMRMPSFSNVLIKTTSRLEWYMKEVIPVFIYASIILWFAKITGILDMIINAMQPIVRLLGLPIEASQILILGFFRRDYGAAGLFDIQHLLTGNQLLIIAVVLTLFIPCIANLMVMGKERGWKTAWLMVGIIVPFALFIGFLLNTILKLLGVQL